MSPFSHLSRSVAALYREFMRRDEEAARDQSDAAWRRRCAAQEAFVQAPIESLEDMRLKLMVFADSLAEDWSGVEFALMPIPDQCTELLETVCGAGHRA